MKENYTLQELGQILSVMYRNAEQGRQVTAIHMFGIMYAPYIIANKYSPKQIIDETNMDKSYSTEVNKGVNIYKSISSGKYDVQLVLGQTENKEIKQNTVATTYQTVELIDFITNPFSHRYLTSLLAKPFVILAGNSGTGKTKIALRLAHYFSATRQYSDIASLFKVGEYVGEGKRQWRVASFSSDTLYVNSDENQGRLRPLPFSLLNEYVQFIQENPEISNIASMEIRSRISDESYAKFDKYMYGFHGTLVLFAKEIMNRQAKDKKDGVRNITNHLLVPVGADWTDNTKLLGYFNPLANDGAGHYVKTEILRFLEDAGANPHIPFFLILDEMNLSRVERYFSDFLSIMETVSYGEGSPDVFLELDGYPGGKLKFPRNLFITGTVNVDETTYMFSPKVLDRANVIEFKPESADVLGNFISDSAAQAIEPAEAGMAESFLSLAQKIRGSSRLAEGVKIEEVERILRAVYEAVQDTDFAFAFRTTKEMRHYVNAAYAIEPTASIVSVLDQQVLQKILPKIHGSRSQLKDVLERLAQVCHEQQLEESGKKIAAMQRRLESSQFTSFM